MVMLHIMITPIVDITLEKFNIPRFSSIIRLNNNNVFIGGYHNKLYFFDIDKKDWIKTELDVGLGEKIDQSVCLVQVNDELMI